MDFQILQQESRGVELHVWNGTQNFQVIAFTLETNDFWIRAQRSQLQAVAVAHVS